MTVIRLTHKGWFGLCPVYLGAIGSDAPHVHERHWLFWPLLELSHLFFELCFLVQDMAGAEPTGWPLRITGRLREPVVLMVPE